MQNVIYAMSMRCCHLFVCLGIGQIDLKIIKFNFKINLLIRWWMCIIIVSRAQLHSAPFSLQTKYWFIIMNLFMNKLQFDLIEKNDMRAKWFNSSLSVASAKHYCIWLFNISPEFRSLGGTVVWPLSSLHASNPINKIKSMRCFAL